MDVPGFSHHQHNIRYARGFTLIELIAAIVITGVLASAAAAAYNVFVGRAHDTVAADAAFKLGAMAADLSQNGDFGPGAFANTYNVESAIDNVTVPDVTDGGTVVFSSQSHPVPSTQYGTFSVGFATSASGRLAGVAHLSNSGNCIMSLIDSAGGVVHTETLTPSGNQFTSENGIVDCAGTTVLDLYADNAQIMDVSDTGELTTPGPTLLAPGPVNGLLILTDSGNTVNLNWQAPNTGGAPTSYAVRVTYADGSALPGEPSVTVTGTSAEVSGLTTDVGYTFFVAAVNASGSSLEVPVSAVAPVAPSALFKNFDSLGAGQAKISWVASTGATSYEVYRLAANAAGATAERCVALGESSALCQALASSRQPNTAVHWTRIATTDANTHEYLDSGLGAARYVYLVKAVNPRGVAYSTARVSVVGSTTLAPTAGMIGQGSSLLCKYRADGTTGGKVLLSVPETAGVGGTVYYSLTGQGAVAEGTLDLVLGQGSVIVDWPRQSVGTITFRADSAAGAVIGTKLPSGTFGGQPTLVCP